MHETMKKPSSLSFGNEAHNLKLKLTYQNYY